MRDALPRSVWLVILVAAALGLVRIVAVGLSDPSEGRYAEIAREMAEGGDWLIPHWQGVHHLEKPPLAYWAAAAGIRVFGRHDFAVRLAAALAFFVSVLLTARIAARVAGPRAAAPAAAALALAPLPVFLGTACLTEPFLLLSVTLFYHAVFRYLDRRAARDVDLAALALVLGVLAKGHVVFLFTLLPLSVARTGAFARLFRLRPLAILLLGILPWPIAVEFAFPGFFREHAQRLFDFVGTGKDHHHAPFFVYAVALLAGVFPFSVFAFPGARRTPAEPRRVLLLWVGLPFVILTLARGRSWTYILPAVPAVAVLAGAYLAHARTYWVQRRPAALAGVCLGGALLVLIVPRLPFWRSDVHRLAPALVWAAGALAVYGLAVFHLSKRRPFVTAAVFATTVSAAFLGAALTNQAAFKIHKSLAERVQRLAGADGSVVLAVSNTPSVAFYLDRPAKLVAYHARLSWEAERWGGSEFYEPSTDLARLLREDKTSWIVIHKEHLASLGVPRRVLFEQRKICVLARPVDGPGPP